MAALPVPSELDVLGAIRSTGCGLVGACPYRNALSFLSDSLPESN